MWKKVAVTWSFSCLALIGGFWLLTLLLGLSPRDVRNAGFVSGGQFVNAKVAAMARLGSIVSAICLFSAVSAGGFCITMLCVAVDSKEWRAALLFFVCFAAVVSSAYLALEAGLTLAGV